MRARPCMSGTCGPSADTSPEWARLGRAGLLRRRSGRPACSAFTTIAGRPRAAPAHRGHRVRTREPLIADLEAALARETGPARPPGKSLARCNEYAWSLANWPARRNPKRALALARRAFELAPKVGPNTSTRSAWSSIVRADTLRPSRHWSGAWAPDTASTTGMTSSSRPCRITGRVIFRGKPISGHDL